ncbi:methyltransferase-like protein 24, partial [Biomphalaria glabrata]
RPIVPSSCRGLWCRACVCVWEYSIRMTKSISTYKSKKLLIFIIVTFIAITVLYIVNITQRIHEEATSSEKKDTKWRDSVDNSRAAAFLKNYNKMFAQNQTQTPEADPNNVITIQTWWQAAAIIDWYYNGPKRYDCKQVKPMGNWHICQDPPYTVSPPCLVYSFGINYDFSFDDAMVSLGCEVHSFDPSMNMETHKRKNGNFSYFYKWGLSNVNADAYEPRKDVYVKNVQSWKMRTLKSVIKELGHEERTIDVLKMDIEGYEWGVVDNLLETDVLKQVRQFLIEYHLFPSFPARAEYVYLYQTISRVREMGFREFHYGDEPRNINEANFNNQRVVDYVSFFFHQ